MSRRILLLSMLALWQAISIARATGAERFQPPRVLVGNTSPAYPSQSRRHEHEGTVVLRLAVSARGAVDVLGVTTSSGHSLLDAAAADYARTLRAMPARAENGQAVDSETLLCIVFKLDAPQARPSLPDLSKRV